MHFFFQRAPFRGGAFYRPGITLVAGDFFDSSTENNVISWMVFGQNSAGKTQQLNAYVADRRTNERTHPLIEIRENKVIPLDVPCAEPDSFLRMQSFGEPDRIHATVDTVNILRTSKKFKLESRGTIDIKVEAIIMMSTMMMIVMMMMMTKMITKVLMVILGQRSC